MTGGATHITTTAINIAFATRVRICGYGKQYGEYQQ